MASPCIRVTPAPAAIFVTLPPCGAVDQMLHLHGFEHRDLLPGADEIAFAHLDRDDRALQRRRHRRPSRRDRPLRPRFRGPRGWTPQRRLPAAPAPKDRSPHATSAATWVSMKPVLMRLATKSGCASTAPRNGMLVATPPMRNSRKVRVGLLHHVGPVRAGRMHDDLGEQRVEGGAGLVAGIAERIDAHARARPADRTCDSVPPVGLVDAVLVHHLHVDAKLHRIAARLRDIGLRQAERAQRGAGGDRKLRLHQIDAEHLLGHGVLDLQPRIGLDEGERLRVARGVAIDQEFEGAEIVVVRGGGELPWRRR